MTAPYKICPRCQTPAALEAPVCAHCGRQYRTQFVPPPGGAPVSAPAPEPPVSEGVPAPAAAALTLPMLGVVALAAFCAILLTAVLFYRGTFGGHQTPRPIAVAQPPPPVASPVPVDPLTQQAQRAVERASKQLGLPPPGTVDSKGMIHLRSGGTISREEWEAAHRKLQEDPLVSGSQSVPRL